MKKNILLLVILCLFLAACGNGDKAENKEETKKETTKQEVSEDKSAEKEKTEEVEVKGDTVDIGKGLDTKTDDIKKIEDDLKNRESSTPDLEKENKEETNKIDSNTEETTSKEDPGLARPSEEGESDQFSIKDLEADIVDNVDLFADASLNEKNEFIFKLKDIGLKAYENAKANPKDDNMTSAYKQMIGNLKEVNELYSESKIKEDIIFLIENPAKAGENLVEIINGKVNDSLSITK